MNPITIIHYLAFMPSYHFGMSEEQFISYSSSHEPHEPRSLVLAGLRDELGWEVSLHVLTSYGRRIVVAPPLKIPIYFHPVTGRHLLPVIKSLRGMQRLLLRFCFSASFVSQVIGNPPDLIIFRGNIHSLPSRLLARWFRMHRIVYIYEHHGANFLVSKKLVGFVNGAKRLFVLTKEIKETIVQGYGLNEERVAIIPNGVNTSLFRPHSRDPKIPYPRLAFVGRLSPAKGFDIAIDSLIVLRSQWPQACLEVAGQPLPSSQSFFEQAMRRGENAGLSDAIVWHRWLDDSQLVQLYNRADVLLFPSRIPKEGGGEGEPRTVLEAMSCGLPVFAVHSSGGHCEIIAKSSAGRLAPNAALFTESLFDYLRNQTKVAQDRMQARQYILENHSIEAVFEAYRRSCIDVLERA